MYKRKTETQRQTHNLCCLAHRNNSPSSYVCNLTFDAMLQRSALALQYALPVWMHSSAALDPGQQKRSSHPISHLDESEIFTIPARCRLPRLQQIQYLAESHKLFVERSLEHSSSAAAMKRCAKQTSRLPVLPEIVERCNLVPGGGM
uniref:Uncharacterized protein n=1 Tax=Anopheles coluzzii TaxID=1518534 RepID=A0A8W7PBI0_ANOCL